MSISTLKTFISIAENHGLPVVYLRRVIRDYDIKIKSGSGTAYVEPFWNNLILYKTTISGLRDPSEIRSSLTSVQTLYHEATHAYIDIIDADDRAMFKNAQRHYKRAKLSNGGYVDDTERVVEEAAGSYVGHRVATVWSVWVRMALMNSVLDKVESKDLSASRGAEVIKLIKEQNRGTIPEVYNREMAQRVFGYQDVSIGGGCSSSTKQVSVESRKIPPGLQMFCEEEILEFKIKNRFDQMRMFHFSYENLKSRMSICRE